MRNVILLLAVASVVGCRDSSGTHTAVAGPTLSPVAQAAALGDIVSLSTLADQATKTESTSALAAAVSTDQVAAARLLIRKGALSDGGRDASLMTAAANSGDTEMISLLHDNGVPATEKAVFEAARCGHTEAAKLLVSLGASVGWHGPSGETLMQWAKKFGTPKMVRTVQQLGVKG